MIIPDLFAENVLHEIRIFFSRNDHGCNPSNRQDEHGHRGRSDAVQKRLVVELHHAGAVLGLERGVRLDDDNEGEKDTDPLDDGKEHVEPNPTQTMQR